MINTKDDEHESHARQQGGIFAKDILDYITKWQGPAAVTAMVGYIASKNGIKIGNTQLTIGLGMMTAGLVAEAALIKQENPEVDIKAFQSKMTSRWRQRIQAPSNVNLIIGMVGMLKKIAGSEAAFIAGAIGTVLHIIPDMIEKC